MTQLKKLTFDELKTEFEKLVKSIENFVSMETDERVKRQGVQLEQEFSKKQKTIEEVSVLEEKYEIGIDAIPTATKPPSIVDWKIIPQSGLKIVYQIIRRDGSDKIYMSFGAILKDFSRDDLTELYRLVIKKYGENRPEEMYDRVLWADLKTMFDPPLSDDAIWSLPLQQKMINWRTDGNAEFHKIIDFLTRSLIHYALTISHVISTTFVEQFWMTAKSKTINNVRYITATVAGKPVSILEASIRKDEGAVSERPFETQPTPSLTHPSKGQSEPQPDPFLRPSSSNPIPNSIPEGSGRNHGAQAANIKDLKAQIKQLKKKARPIINHHKGRKTFKSVPTVHKDPAFDDLDDAMDYMETEDAHDEGTVKDSEETRVSTEDQVSTDKPKVSTDKLKVSTDKPNEGTAEPNEGTAEPKDGNSDESAAPTTVFRDDETIAQFLVTMSQNKTKQKGVEIKEIKDTDRPRTTTERSILTLKPLPKIDPKDKGKKVLEEKVESDAESEGVNEAEKKFKMLANDEEIARKVQEEWEAEEEKKKLAEEEATKAAFTNEYDFIQARLNADKILAEKLQEEEREKFTIEQRAKFLHDTIAAQRRFLAQQRSEAIRNKLPTRNQLRNQMMTYLKYVGGYRHAQLNKKKFEEIQVMYEKVKRANENFIPIGSAKDEKLIEKMNKKAAGMDKEEVSEEPESTKVKAKIEEPKENIRKRSGRRLKMKAPKRSKRQKTDSDHEEENQLRTFLKIVPEEEEKIDYEVLGTRYPIINWESKFYDYGHFGRELIYYRVFRADGSSRWIKTFSEMIKFFDRMDLVEIHSLVMKRFETTPPEGIDLLLWGDLRIMFESKEDDELWKNQEEWKLQSWIFYENCGVHVLRLEDGTEINMLAERRYPLTKNTLERMMDLRLTAVSDDDTVFDLLRFIEQQIDEFGGQDGSEKDL
ncbi:hypothetical protein Tco_1133029 [Tanacetum coccineum]|uniref:Uncharacterized protein n=1 Tax=Tanacetum coccineum TaxID=301880 RepID=A0ABQ5JGG7_9ASTR